MIGLTHKALKESSWDRFKTVKANTLHIHIHKARTHTLAQDDSGKEQHLYFEKMFFGTISKALQI